MPQLDHQLDLESIEFAFDKLNNFAQVHQDKTPLEKVGPVNLLFESVGMGTDQILAVAYYLKEMGTNSHEESAFFLGMIAGLLVTQWYE